MNTDDSENPHSTFSAQIDDLIKLLEVCHHQASRAGHAAMDARMPEHARELFASSGRLKSMAQEWERMLITVRVMTETAKRFADHCKASNKSQSSVFADWVDLLANVCASDGANH